MTDKTFKAIMVEVHDEETETQYYLTADVYQWYFSSRGLTPEDNPAAHRKTLQAQAHVIVHEYDLARNHLWPVTTVNELLVIMDVQAERWGEEALHYKKCSYQGVTYYIEGFAWDEHFEEDVSRGVALSASDLMAQAVFAYKQHSIVKCTFTCKLGSWEDILSRLESLAEVVELNDPAPLVDVRPYQDSYTLAEVQALIDENASLTKEVERLENAQVWYANALEVLSPLRYHGHQLLESPDRVSLQEALKLMIDKAEDFFTKRAKKSETK